MAWENKARVKVTFPEYLVVFPQLGNKPLARPTVGDSNRKKSTAQYITNYTEPAAHISDKY
jgi:hypothetical protein